MCYNGNMGIRDREIERIVKYANGLGVKVIWKKYKRGDDGASWHLDGSAIEMYVWPDKSKTQIILDFIHELGHHMAWVYSGRKNDLKTDRAYELDGARGKKDPPISKAQRKIIYEAEKYDSQYRDQIFKELGIKIPKYRLDADKEYDFWIYRRYYLTGKIPTEKEMRVKRRELIEKHRRRSEAKDGV